MVKTERMMEIDESGVGRQFHPIIHASVVRRLKKIIVGQSKALSVNGYTGVVAITKADPDLGNALTEPPYVTGETGDIATVRMFQRLPNGKGGVYVLSIATVDGLGETKADQLLRVTEDGMLPAAKQTNRNSTIKLKSKLEELRGYTAGANTSISEDGVISAADGGDDGGVNRQYVDQKVQEVTDEIPGITFERVGEVE